MRDKIIPMKNTEKKQDGLNGKTVVITGASSGVGRAAAEAFADLGANVVIFARGQKGIDEVIVICSNKNVIAIGVFADMSLEGDVERAAQGA